MSEVILFQGDSITDAGRNRDNDLFLGVGYATMVQGQLGMLSKLAPNGYWIRDGVHPNAPGHNMIKEEWIKAFKKL